MTGEIRHRFRRVQGLQYPEPLLSVFDPQEPRFFLDDKPLRQAIPMAGRGKFALLRSTGELELRGRTLTAARESRVDGEDSGFGVLAANPDRKMVMSQMRPRSIDELGIWNHQFLRFRRPSGVQAWKGALRVAPIKPVRYLAISNDGRALGICGTQLWRFDLKQGKWMPSPVRTKAAGITSIGFTSGNRMVWIEAGKLHGLITPIAADHFTIAPSGKTLAIAAGPEIQVLSFLGAKRATFRSRRALRFRHLAVCDDGKCVAALTETALHLFQGKEEQVLPFYYATGRNISFSGDGRMLVLPRYDDFVVIHPGTGIPRVIGASFNLGSVRMSPYGSGAEVLVWCRSGFYVLDTARGKVRRAFPKAWTPAQNGARWILAAPDCAHLLIVGRTAMSSIANIEPGKMVWVDPKGRIDGARWEESGKSVLLWVARDAKHHCVRVDLGGKVEALPERAWTTFSVALHGGMLEDRSRAALRLAKAPIAETVAADHRQSEGTANHRAVTQTPLQSESQALTVASPSASGPSGWPGPS